jgi:hypothetical protein
MREHARKKVLAGADRRCVSSFPRQRAGVQVSVYGRCYVRLLVDGIVLAIDGRPCRCWESREKRSAFPGYPASLRLECLAV